MMRKRVLAAGVLLTCLGLAALASGVTIDFVPVGNPGNAGRLSGFPPFDTICGAVACEYEIAKYEVTAGQYTEFLNAVAATDTYGLYNALMATSPQACGIVQSGGSGSFTYATATPNLPVNYVNWGDAARFANWLHNGQPTGPQDLTTTEDGAYFVNGATTSPVLFDVIREADAIYFMPTDNEWYKASYHKNDGVTGNYWEYATSNDVIPTAEAPPGGANSVNYSNAVGNLVDIGSYVASVSAYGTFDQNGNVMEWTETNYILVPYGNMDCNVVRGGGYNDSYLGMYASGRAGEFDRTAEKNNRGFRVAALGGAPEPPHIEGLEVFYNGKYADAADPAKSFLALGEASSMSRVGDDLHGNVTNCSQGITGIRVKFDAVVAFSGGAAAAFSYEATPEQSADKTFTAFTPPTAPVYVVDDSSGKTVVTITFTNGEIKNRWLKTIIDASQVSAGGVDLDGELPSPLSLPSGDGTAGGNAEFIIGNRFGDADANYRCLLNDAILIRSKASGALVGISNAYDVDKNERALLNDAILTRNAVSGTALPALP